MDTSGATSGATRHLREDVQDLIPVGNSVDEVLRGELYDYVFADRRNQAKIKRTHVTFPAYLFEVY